MGVAEEHLVVGVTAAQVARMDWAVVRGVREE